MHNKTKQKSIKELLNQVANAMAWLMMEYRCHRNELNTIGLMTLLNIREDWDLEKAEAIFIELDKYINSIEE